MNRYNYYNSELDAFTNYHLEAEPENVRNRSDGPTDESNALIAGVSGAIGTSIANLAVYPIDLIVKRLQVQRQIRGTVSKTKATPTLPENLGSAQVYTGDILQTGRELEGRVQEKARQRLTEAHELYTDFADAAKRIYKEEGGIGAFYSGCLHDTANSMGNAFLYYLSYNFIRERRLRSQANGGNTAKTLGMIEELGVGVLAGAISKCFTSPISNVVTRKQVAAIQQPRNEGILTSASTDKVASNTTIPTVRSILQDIYKEKGITGFWSGYKATLFLTMNPSITLFLYETFKTLLPRKFREEPTAGQTFLIAAVAKAVASSLMYPFSLAKARGQVQQDRDANKSNLFQMLSDIYAIEGIKGLYEGMQGEVLKGFFQNGITMLIKEFLHRNILWLYYVVARIRSEAPNQSLSSTVYQKVTSETPQTTLDRISSASQEKIEVAKIAVLDTKDTIANEIQNTVSTITSVSQNGYEAAKEKVSNGYEVVKDAVQSNAKSAKTSVSNMAARGGDTIQDGYSIAKDSLQSNAASAKNNISNMASKGGEAAISSKDMASETIQSGLESAKTKLSSVISKSGEAIQNGKKSLNQATVDAREGLANMIDPNTTSRVEPPVGDVSREVGGIEWNDKE